MPETPFDFSEEMWSSLVQNSADVIALIGPDRIIRWMNHSPTPEVSVEQVIGTHMFDWVVPEYQQLSDDLVEQALTTGQSGQYEVELEIAGEPWWFLNRIGPVEVAGKVVGIALVSTNISERTRAQLELERTSNELRRSNRDLESFAAVAAHDLRSPLSVISGFADLLSDAKVDLTDEERKRQLQFIVEYVERMDRVIGSLLEFAKVRAREPVFSDVSLDDCVAMALGNLEHQIKEMGVTIDVAELPVVQGNRELLMLLYQNLIANAASFGADKIFLDVEQEGDGVVLGVRDNGPGVPQEFHESIFEPFRRLKGESEGGGIGLGLATCHRIVTFHQGKIWLDTGSAPGSHFRFTLPAAGESN